MQKVHINKIQGADAFSPMAGETVTVLAQVTGHSRKGFFIQQDDETWNGSGSNGVFVYSPRQKPDVASIVEVSGQVVDFRKSETEKPVTQIGARNITERISAREVIASKQVIKPIWLDEILPQLGELTRTELIHAQAKLLNSLEGMLVGVRQGARFIAGSNAFGDYTLALANDDTPDQFITPQGGCLLDPDRSGKWYPSLRIVDYDRAPVVNLGAKLKNDVVGCLNYRASAYQIACNHDLSIEHAKVEPSSATLDASANAISVMTLNGFNLDVKVEEAAMVQDPRRDIDDDIGDGRFKMLAKDIVELAREPDIIALQEIQDDDGAEITAVVSAKRTYQHLVSELDKISSVDYKWFDVPPEANADGGQPGGNIRNGFIFNADKLELVIESVKRIGDNELAFEGSRKPVVAEFKHRDSGVSLAVINIHLASKRHQHGKFSVDRPSFDPKEQVRIDQGKIIRKEMLSLQNQKKLFYVTGDFNDNEYSKTLEAVCGYESANLVMTLPLNERYDYNHRGKLQTLMHGLVDKQLLENQKAQYQILHGNELQGVQPGTLGNKPSDHAYVLASLALD